MLLPLLFFRLFQQSDYIFTEGVILLFLSLYLPKFRLQGGLAGGEPIQFRFQLFGGREFGESGLLDFPCCRLEQNNLSLKATQEFFLVP